MNAKRNHKYPISYLHIHQNHSNSVPLSYFSQQLEKRKLVTVRLNYLPLSPPLSAKNNQKRRDLWMGANNGATYYAIL